MLRGRHGNAFSLSESLGVNPKRYDVTASGQQILGRTGLGANERDEFLGLRSTDWGPLDEEAYEHARLAVGQLRSNGFFCVLGPAGFGDPDRLWAILTYSYGKRQFGSQELAEWIELEPVLGRELGRNRILSSDIRQFRRNNRKVLTLSLEGFFYRGSSRRVQRLRKSYDLSECDLAERIVLEAIRSDFGEVEF